jgi:hypothetical protein
LAKPLKQGDDCIFSWEGKQVEGIVRNVHENGRMSVEYTQVGVKCPPGFKLVLDDLDPNRFSRPEPRFCSSPAWVATTVEATGFAAEEVRAFFHSNLGYPNQHFKKKSFETIFSRKLPYRIKRLEEHQSDPKVIEDQKKMRKSIGFKKGDHGAVQFPIIPCLVRPPRIENIASIAANFQTAAS